MFEHNGSACHNIGRAVFNPGIGGLMQRVITDVAQAPRFTFHAQRVIACRFRLAAQRKMRALASAN